MKKERIQIIDIFFFVGFLFVVAFVIVTLNCGDGAFVSIHDQLDGEVLAYVLRARHIRDAIIPEFMGGVSKEALLPASYGTLFFYILCAPANAFNINYGFVQIVSYVGLYLLLTKLHVNHCIAAIVSVLFCFLPFYSVYGLAVMGQPLMWYGCLMLWEKRTWKPYVIGIIFALFSSPVLIGYADCAVICMIVLVCIFARDVYRVNSFILLLLTLLGVYVFLYRGILIETFSPAYVGHRAEFVLSTIGNIKSTIETIWNGGQPHAISNHKELVPWIIMTLFSGIIFLPVIEVGKRKMIYALAMIVGVAFMIAVFYALFHHRYIVDLRNHIETLKSFQFDRFYWFYPGLWYTAFGIAAGLIVVPCIKKECTEGNHRCNIVSRAASIGLCAFLLTTTAYRMWNQSDIKENVNAIINKKNVSMSFQSFYSTSLFEDISKYIGKPKNEYRVASVALYPSIPLYNGFYCVDGYSNNYPLEYKHRFREVIAAELNKNEDVRKYFDEWGNRCYVFSAELGKQYFYTKENTEIVQKLELNIEALKDLQCEYIFSGVEIQNWEGKLVNTFEDNISPYKVWVYRV